MRIADILHSKISDEIEFWPDWTIHFGVTRPLVPKKPILDLVRNIVCLVIIKTL